jgi:hypothetical protein
VDDVVVQRHRFREVRLHRERPDAVRRDELPKHSVFQLEELASAMRCLAEADDRSVSQSITDRRQVVAVAPGVGRRDRNHRIPKARADTAR